MRRATAQGGVARRALPATLRYTLRARAARGAAGITVGAWRSLVARIVRDDEVGGSNPLAPTTYGYSELLWQHLGEAVADGMLGEVGGRLL